MTAEEKKETERKNPAVLVAGGAGFIGSHLCESLLDADFLVYCVDNLSTGSKENIKDLLTNPNFHFFEADITQPLEFLNSIEHLEIIFHLASLDASADKNFSLETLLVNSSGTRNLLEAAKKFQTKFILVSASDIYQGSYSSSSLKSYFGAENHEALMSQHEAKRFAEALTVEFFKNYNLKANIARVADVYGPKLNLRSKLEINQIIADAKENSKIVIEGDGLRTLNPTYVTDVIFGLLKIANGEFAGDIFNLISSEKTTVAGLAETLRLVSGEVEIISKEEKNPLNFPPAPLDLEPTYEKLKWHPRVSLAEGLSSTFQSFNGPIAKLVDFAPEAAVEKKPEAKKGGLIKKIHLRIAIFSLSIFLIVFTTIVPAFYFVLQTSGGIQKLTEAAGNLEQDRTATAGALADTSNGDLQKADQSLNNIRWIFQLTGQRASLRANEQLLFSGENSANGLKLLSQVVQKIIDADLVSKAGDGQKAESYLQEANQYLIEARQDLDLSRASLEQVKSSSLAPTLAAKYTSLQNLNTSLTSKSQVIANSLDLALKSLEEVGSTVP